MKEDPKDAGFEVKCKTHLLGQTERLTHSYFNAGHPPPMSMKSLRLASSREILSSLDLCRQLDEPTITGLFDDYDQDHLHDVPREDLESDVRITRPNAY